MCILFAINILCELYAVPFLFRTQVVNVLDTYKDVWELSRNEIEIGDQLGQGNYGDVFRGQLAMTAMSPKIYAHKQEMEFEGKSHLTVAVKMH